jgi:hypothetical protein
MATEVPIAKILTVAPDAVPEALTVGEEMFALAFNPAGPLQKVKMKRLLAKLISTDLVKSTRADLFADLAWAADNVALVHNDPTGTYNGWYRKTGASGAGAWVQFEELAKSVRVAAQAARDQAVVEADRAELAVLNAVALVEQATGIYDPIAEFVGGAVGAFAVPELEYFFTDVAGTIPATAEGDVIRCWKPRYTTVAGNYDQIQPDLAKAPVLRKMAGRWYLDFANGKGMYARVNPALKCPQTILFAGSVSGALARAAFGMVNNANAGHYLASDTNDRMRGYADGAASLARALKIATTANYSAPRGAMAVYYSSLAPGALYARFDTGLDQAGNSPITVGNTWLGGDTIADMSLGINIGSQALGLGVPVADAGCKCFGWMIIDKAAFDNAAGVVGFFQQYTQPEMRAADLSIFKIADSLSDDQTVSTEIARYFAINGLVVDHPTKDVFYRVWNRDANCYGGYQALTPGNRAERVFLNCAASAGAQPSYFTAGRFEAVTDLHHVDERIPGMVHNLAVTEPTAQTHPQAGLLRLGELIEMEDQFRAKWPDAPVLMEKSHPAGIPGDNRTLPVLAAMDILQDQIYRDITFVRIDQAFEATGRNPALYQGDLIHHTEAGVALAGDTLIAAYRAWVRPAKVTPPVLARRRIPASEMVIAGGLFEDWAGALPVGTALTNGTVTKSIDQMLRGPSLKLVGAPAGDSYVQWDFDATPYQGSTVVLTLWQLIQTGSDFETGQIQAGSNGTGHVGNSWIYTANKSYDTWEPRILHLPIPANATTAWFRMYGGSGATGIVHIDRAVSARGIIPRDVLL